jgi:hypothetical protein
METTYEDCGSCVLGEEQCFSVEGGFDVSEGLLKFWSKLDGNSEDSMGVK